MKKFLKLYKNINGSEKLKQLFDSHLIIYTAVTAIVLGFSKKSLEIVRLAINNKVVNKLRKKYTTFINEHLKNKSYDNHTHSDYVWVCWLQGIENAPDLVKKCIYSIQNNLYEKNIVLLTENNYKEYVKFPEYIQNKIDNGIISKTHISDLLRLELLIKYGGTWIDATVYCSGNEIPDYMFNSDLFLFQNLKPGLDGNATCISSWFITACTNNPILVLTKELLYKYWSEHNKMIDYFLIHDFFQLAIEAYPDEWKKVIPFSNSTPHILLLKLFEEYDELFWNSIINQTNIHKLSYKFDNKMADLPNTYFKHIMRQ